jgi:hypothetical protein
LKYQLLENIFISSYDNDDEMRNQMNSDLLTNQKICIGVNNDQCYILKMKGVFFNNFIACLMW